jgi:hypothetical protein
VYWLKSLVYRPATKSTDLDVWVQVISLDEAHRDVVETFCAARIVGLMSGKMRTYIREVNDYTGFRMGTVKIQPRHITGKGIEFVFPMDTPAAHRAAIEAVSEYANSFNITMKVFYL